MRVSLSWLKEFVHIKESPGELADLLTMLGLEAEPGTDFSEVCGVVIGKVMHVKKHPNADKLTLCTVNNGSENVKVVCGAPNVEPGQIVPFAGVGSSLPGGITLEKVKIRGTFSNGMICSERELGISDEHEGIMVLPESLEIGQTVNDFLEETYSALELDLTPNRPDALSHIGVARDIAVKTGRKLKKPKSLKGVAKGASGKHVSVKITAAKGCPRYIAGVVRNIKVGPSPDWMVEKLKAAGMRSINNVVDISNYILLELGHPTHIFDFSKITNGKIVVRMAWKKEKLLGLDGEEYNFEPHHLLITDGDNPLAIAGIMGGEESAVTEKSTSVVIESAYFNPVIIRRGAKSLGLRTEASRRFERGADIEGCVSAYWRVVDLLEEIAGGEAVPGFVDAYPKKFTSKTISLRRSELDLVTGQKISDNFVEKTLKSMEIIVRKSKSGWNCTPPTFRPDLEREIDLIEEIIRMYGYEKVKSSQHFSGLHEVQKPDPHQSLERIISMMSGMGYSQCFTNSLNSAEISKAGEAKPVSIVNPLSEKMSHMRTSLLPGLIKTAAFNTANGSLDQRLFEIGNIFSRTGKGLKGIQETMVLSGLVHGNWTAPGIHSGRQVKSSTFAIKGSVESLLRRIHIEDVVFPELSDPIFQMGSNIIMAEKTIGSFGQISESYLKSHKFEVADVFTFTIELSAILDILNQKASYKTINPYPVVERDLNFVISQKVKAGEVCNLISRNGGKILKSVTPVNFYQDESLDEGSRSFTFRMIFQHPSKTLEDSDVNPVINEIIDIVSKEFDGKLRA